MIPAIAQHTPGPWHVTYDETGGYDGMTGGYHIAAVEDQRITTVDGADYGQVACQYAPTPQAEANARLIAAAPDLYAQLTAMCDYADIVREKWETNELADVVNMLTVQARQARFVLAKAWETK